MNKHTCKHYNGSHHNTHCDAGVCYKDVTTGTDSEPGSAFRKPCVNWDSWDKQPGRMPMTESQRKEWDRRGTCDKFIFPTDDEIKLHEAELKSHFEKFRSFEKWFSPMRDSLRGSQNQVLNCPVCNGKVHVFVSSYNGHARVHCETDGCVRFIE